MCAIVWQKRENCKYLIGVWMCAIVWAKKENCKYIYLTGVWMCASMPKLSRKKFAFFIRELNKYKEQKTLLQSWGHDTIYPSHT